MSANNKLPVGREIGRGGVDGHQASGEREPVNVQSFGSGEVRIVGSGVGMNSLQAESGEIVWMGHHLHLKIGKAVGLTNSPFS